MVTESSTSSGFAPSIENEFELIAKFGLVGSAIEISGSPKKMLQ